MFGGFPHPPREGNDRQAGGDENGSMPVSAEGLQRNCERNEHQQPVKPGKHPFFHDITVPKIGMNNCSQNSELTAEPWSKLHDPDFVFPPRKGRGGERRGGGRSARRP